MTHPTSSPRRCRPHGRHGPTGTTAAQAQPSAVRFWPTGSDAAHGDTRAHLAPPWGHWPTGTALGPRAHSHRLGATGPLAPPWGHWPFRCPLAPPWDHFPVSAGSRLGCQRRRGPGQKWAALAARSRLRLFDANGVEALVKVDKGLVGLLGRAARLLQHLYQHLERHLGNPCSI